MKTLAIAAAALALTGCVVADVAETAVAVAKVPVKVASAGIDAATTSQSEADEKRGRELREADERRARDQRRAAEAAKKAAETPQSE